MTTLRKLAAVFLLGSFCAVSGCVERKITIGSSPEGALVTLNDEEIGRTPITVPFLWYGDYNVILRLEKNVGTAEKPDIRRYYLHTHQSTDVPWFQWIPIDLFTELLPMQFKDEKVWAFTIPEVKNPPEQELIQRAREAKASLDQPEPLKDKAKTAPSGGSTQPAAPAQSQP